MDDKALQAFAKTLGTAYVALESQVADANRRLSELGEPTILVEAPRVDVGGAVVQFDTAAIVDALTGFDVGGVSEAIDGLSEAVRAIEPQQVDTAGIVDAIAAAGVAEAIGQLAEIMRVVLEQQGFLVAAVSEASKSLADSVAMSTKIEAANRAHFNAIMEQIQKGDDRITRALTAPRRIIEEDGKPVGVESVVN